MRAARCFCVVRSLAPAAAAPRKRVVTILNATRERRACRGSGSGARGGRRRGESVASPSSDWASTLDARAGGRYARGSSARRARVGGGGRGATARGSGGVASSELGAGVMGINALLPSLKSIVRTLHVGDAYAGKRVAVDSYCWLHRGAYSCSVELVEGVPTDKFVVSFMKRAALLKRCGVDAVYVFDGGRMPGKASEEADRQRSREQARERARAHRRAGNAAAAAESYQRAVDVSPEMAKAVIERLKTEGYQCVVAPYEADAQMAYLVRNGFVDGVITEDSDMVPHQCKSVFFKMDNDGVGQEIRYADVVVNRELSFVGFTPDQFLEMCVMSGCDYLPSLPGVGIKRAHGLIRRFRSHDKALRNLRFEGTPVPRRYEEGFRDALLTFKHQWVFCPTRREMVHLSEGPGSDGAPPPMSSEDVDRLIGPRHPPEIAGGWRTASSTPCICARTKPCARQGLPPRDRGDSRRGVASGAARNAKRTRADADAAPGITRFFAAARREASPRRRPASANAALGGSTGRDGSTFAGFDRFAADAFDGGARVDATRRELGDWAKRRGGSRDRPTAAQVALADAAARARHGREADVLFAPAEESGGGGVGG